MGWAFNWAVELGPALAPGLSIALVRGPHLCLPTKQIGSSKCRQTDARKLGVGLCTGKVEFHLDQFWTVND